MSSNHHPISSEDIARIKDMPRWVLILEVDRNSRRVTSYDLTTLENALATIDALQGTVPAGKDHQEGQK